MRNVRFVMAFIITVLTTGMTLAATQPAHVCSTGVRHLSIQHSDIRLEPGVLTYKPLRIMTVSLPIPATDCGIWAKSELPGLHVISGYGVVPPVTNPPGVWTPIGSSADASLTTQPWNRLESGRVEFFGIMSEGNIPAGTQSRILLAVNQGGDGEMQMLPIGSINVHVGYPSTPTPTWFTVSSTVRNVSANRVAVSHPLLNGNPGARLFVAHLINPPGLTPMYWNHPLVTRYDGNLRQWVIANADGTQMPAGLGFNVRIDPSASQYFTGDPAVRPPVKFVEINDPIANNNPYATIAVSMTADRAVNAHPVAVAYNGSRWRIVNSDNTLIPAGVRFNVRVIGFSAYHADISPNHKLDMFVSNSAGISVRDITAPPVPAWAGRLLHFWWAGGNRTLPMLITPNLSPMGTTAPTTGKYVGLKYVEGIRPRWSVFHEDQSPIPSNAAFNILAQPQPLLY